MKINNLDNLDLLNTLAIEKPTYLDDKEHDNELVIVKYISNYYYNKEPDYIKDGDWYSPKDEYRDCMRVHKSCFAHPLSKIVIATIIKEKEVNIKFVLDRPLDLNRDQWMQLKSLLKEAYNELTE